ncbi:cytochrome P450 [Streptosporangium becharense]|uniref:Cytochrome P450 n=1 Tax=Streptosporangium becharense TaxID=1816182 RepID=A0A7W9IH86_9ACTN|nr:cytochrome P450 [Streptosporangium becharense]MBB2912502.1 cytochrome P450 [Streptosporangium becharense]MBB5820668.1 cytochrome P450 [Streptosporangium becharense]
MAESHPEAITFPSGRPGPFDPPASLGALREECPVTPMVYPDGRTGWLVTGYAAVRSVLADPRFSARRELLSVPVPSPLAQEMRRPAEPGMFIRMDPPDHTRYRRLLTAQFTVRRMRQLEPRVREITAECLAAMEKAGPPQDLVREFALPIPSLVICELLGVPYADREEFQRATAVLVNLEATADDLHAAIARVGVFFTELIARKRAEPADDLLGGLVESGELTDEELANIGFLLLAAGHETTANMLGLGTFALLQNPEQLAALRADPALADNAVEELLRYLSIIHIGPVRAALADVELEGRLIRAGDVVTVSVPAANRDPARFTDPERLDVTRDATGHVTFGHGVHQCLGQQLARVEMRIALPMLFDRFPGLRLAVPAAEVPMRDTMSIYGVRALPISW